MENKINIAELLKDCPEGMELDCTIYDNVTLEYVTKPSSLPICVRIQNKSTMFLSKYGQVYEDNCCKCVIFPKGKATWEGFVPPCKFKDGDIVANQNNNGTWIGIYHKYDCLNESFSSYCYTMRDGKFCANFDNCHECYKTRLATEEEKQRLFDAIKANGYKWNAETKTLDKLIEPSFKVGDKVRHKNNHGVVFTITSIEEDSYVCGAKAAFWFDDQDNYELVPNKFDITTLKPFESRVLVRDSEMGIWLPDFFGCLDNSNECPYMVVGGIRWKYCIPYEGNEHLLGKCDDCIDFYKNLE